MKEPPRRPRGVVFDMDGLLVDTATLYFECGRELARRRNAVLTEDHARRITGMTTLQGMVLWREEFGFPESAAELAHEYESIFEEKRRSELRLMPGARALLARLQEQRIPRSLATSAFRAVAVRNLEQFGLSHFFDFLLCSEDVERGKPDPMIYEMACARWGFEAAEVLVLEDSLHGARAALAAGCRCVAVPSRFTSGLEFPEPALVVEDLSDPRLVEWA